MGGGVLGAQIASDLLQVNSGLGTQLGVGKGQESLAKLKPSLGNLGTGYNLRMWSPGLQDRTLLADHC